MLVATQLDSGATNPIPGVFWMVSGRLFSVRACSFSLVNLWQIATILAAHLCNFKCHGLLDMQKLRVDFGFYMLSRS